MWSWDITKVRGPEKLVYFHLYVIIDIYSRYVVGWLVADRESGALAEALIQECCNRQKIEHNQLIIHSDRGAAMKSKPVSDLLEVLQVTKSLSRPRVSNDNPYSESQFKTLKYHPAFPDRFGCLEDSRIFCQSFFRWYNNVHYHSSLALLTPSTIHNQQSAVILEQRANVLQNAHALNPERFVKGIEAWSRQKSHSTLNSRALNQCPRKSTRRKLLYFHSGVSFMLIQLTLDKLQKLHLTGMARALEQQQIDPNIHSLSFEDRIGLIVDAEEASRATVIACSIATGAHKDYWFYSE